MTDPTAAGSNSEAKSYEQAFERLEAIIARLDSGKAELRETLDLCREGKELIQLCKGELDAVSGELKELDLDALIAELESHEGDGAGPTAQGDS